MAQKDSRAKISFLQVLDIKDFRRIIAQNPINADTIKDDAHAHQHYIYVSLVYIVNGQGDDT